MVEAIPGAVRVPVLLSPEDVAALDDWQHANKIKTRSNAIRELIRSGVKKPAQPKPKNQECA